MCKAAYSKIQDLRLEHDEEWAEFKKQSKLFRMQMDVDRQRRWVGCGRGCEGGVGGGLGWARASCSARTHR